MIITHLAGLPIPSGGRSLLLQLYGPDKNEALGPYRALRDLGSPRALPYPASLEAGAFARSPEAFACPRSP